MNRKMKLETLTNLVRIKIKHARNSGKLYEKDIQSILNFINITTIQKKNLDKFIFDMELKKWCSVLPSVQVIKQSEVPFIVINIPAEKMDATYEWIIEKEKGMVDSGKFLASSLEKITLKTFPEDGSFFQLKLNIPLNIETGYHNLKISDNSGNLYKTKLIVVPEKCYRPEVIKHKKIFGPKVYFYSVNVQNNTQIADVNDIINLIKKLSLYGVDIVGIGPVNQTSVDENKLYNPFLPSDRMFFNTLFLNTDEMLKFIEDKELQIKFLSPEFQELEQAEVTDYKAIFDIKFKKYKLLYQSFRELHINNNTPKAELFYSYIQNSGEKLQKLALFRALQDSLSAEDSKYTNWREWPKSYQNPYSEAVKQFEKNNIEIVEFYKFLQWQIGIQLRNVGRTSYEKNLGVGIYTDLSLCVDPNGAETWIHEEYFSKKDFLKIKVNNEPQKICCPALLPQKLIDSAYSYFVDIIRSNMINSGAVKLLDFNYLLNSEYEVIENENIYKIDYPIEDLLGILALESQRNNCLIVVDMASVPDKFKNLFYKFGIFDEAEFELKKISDENQLKDYFEYLKDQKLQISADLPQTRDIDIPHITKIPNSTYRIQFCKDFTFNDAKEIIPYLKKLGISHIYASPLLRARTGSSHGYDIVDYNSINQEAGTMEEFNSFVDSLHYHGMGLILDIVPNHMGIGKENKWWMDVLENGPSSEFAHYFDIDWKPIKKELYGKVLIPVLGDYYGNVVTNGQLIFKFNENTGKLFVTYYDQEFPLNPSSYPIILEHRIEVLETRLGSLNRDFLEYLSIITIFKNLPKHTSTEYEKITERSREKEIASQRLSELCKCNRIIKGYIEENLIDFKCSKDNPISIQKVHNLLEQQAFRLAFWRVSLDEINYRRFFDINELAAICVEKPDVFSNTHSFIINLIKDKKIDGLRLDHSDGLLEPACFYKELQGEIANKLEVDFDSNEENLLCSEKLPFYIIAEKILAPFEKLHSNWAIHGTVGYEFLNAVNGLFINSKNKDRFSDIYHKFIKKEIDFEETVIECKKLIMNTSLTGELNVLANYLSNISEQYLYYRDYTLDSLRNALIDVMSCFPVYRTYISREDEEITKSRDYIKWAVGLAKSRSLITDTSIFDYIEKILLLEIEPDLESERYQKILDFTLKFQQYTGPLMAKGFEDTCFYRYNRLIALNEVGGHPNKFGLLVDEFHQHNLNKMETTPNCMLNTSTHDTKRSEDVRTRICAISEFPDEWQKAVKKWHSFNKSKKSNNSVEIDKNDEYLIYQTLVGIWPTEKPYNEIKENLRERLENYIIKASKEAKIYTSWLNINPEYEQIICRFIKRILNYPDKHPFWESFLNFQKKIAVIGYLNSVSQCVLKISSPGIPDFYQGNEIFKFSLVDPDNRRPVDYHLIKSVFEKIQPLLNFNPETDSKNIFEDILLPFESGALKLFYTSSALNFRHEKSNLFRLGKYIPLKIEGEKAENIVAFARLHYNQAIITVVPRLIHNLISKEKPLQIKKELLKGTKIILPEELINFKWMNIYTKERKFENNNEILVSEILDILPAAILHGEQVL